MEPVTNRQITPLLCAAHKFYSNEYETAQNYIYAHTYFTGFLRISENLLRTDLSQLAALLQHPNKWKFLAQSTSDGFLFAPHIH